MNQKMDTVLDYVSNQNRRSETMDDLLADLSIIGKDAYMSAVAELDNQGIELNIDDIKTLMYMFIRNINNFSQVMGMFESIIDLLKDMGPIINEMGVDFTYKLHEMEKKGYFEFFKASSKIIENIVTSYSKEDVIALADNVVTILDTVKSLTQPEMLTAMNNALHVYQSMEISEIKEYSLWKVFREMNTPEMKRGMGFIMTFLKNLSKETKN